MDFQHLLAVTNLKSFLRWFPRWLRGFTRANNSPTGIKQFVYDESKQALPHRHHWPIKQKSKNQIKMKTKACEWRWALVFTRFLSVALPLFTKQWGFAFREAISIWTNQYAHQLRILWPKSENLIVPRVSLQGNLTEMWKCLVCDLTAETFNILLNCYCHRVHHAESKI